MDFSDKDLMPNIRIVKLNARSVKNKDQIIVQELTNNDINAAWLNQSELCQGHYEISTHNRPGEKGVVVLY